MNFLQASDEKEIYEMSGCLQECVRAEYTNKRLVSSMNAPWDPKDNGTQVKAMPI